MLVTASVRVCVCVLTVEEEDAAGLDLLSYSCKLSLRGLPFCRIEAGSHLVATKILGATLGSIADGAFAIHSKLQGGGFGGSGPGG